MRLGLYSQMTLVKIIQERPGLMMNCPKDEELFQVFGELINE